MRLAVLSLWLSAFLAFASPTLAQVERQSEAEYNTALAKAHDAASSRDRRVSTEIAYYTGTQRTGLRKIVSDFKAPNSKRTEIVDEFNGKKARSDSFMVNGQHFCKDADKAWKRVDKECAMAGKMVMIPDGDYEYFVEPDPDNYGRKIYIRRASYTDSGSPEREAVRLKFIEIRSIVDETGAIVEYTETRRGGIEPNGWSSTQVTRYQYEPADLKIADPTKGH